MATIGEMIEPLLREYIGNQKKYCINGRVLLKQRKLTDNQRKLLIRIVADHLKELRPRPSIGDKIAWAEATILIFPCLAVNTAPRYVAVFAPKTNGGYLGNRLRNRRRHENQMRYIFAENVPDAQESNDEEAIEMEDMDGEQTHDQLKQQLKDLHPLHNRQEILQITRETFTLRRKFIESATPEMSIFSEYPRFKDTPGLIQQEFAQIHTQADLHLRSFFTPRLQEYFLQRGKKSMLDNDVLDWPKDVQAFYNWVTLLPATSGGKGDRTKRSLISSASTKIKFCGENTRINPTKFPTIFCQGVDRESVTKFYVSFDYELLVACNNFTDALDVLYKSYHVFHIQYESTFKNFFSHLDKYVFKTDDKSVNSTVNSFQLKIQELQDN